MSIVDATEDEIMDWKLSTTVRTQEKHKFGEVFTPEFLIEELLTHIPPSVWRNPDSKWLDPAAGDGHFGAMVYLKLLTTLVDAIPNIQQRKRHILEKMLYMVELNPEHVRTLRHRFGKHNVIAGDFLQQQPQPAQFTVILGNPPYQASRSSTLYPGSQGKRTLWDKFVQHSLPMLETRGYLAFITPAGWRRPESPLYQLMTRQNTLRYLHVFGEKAGRDVFGVQTRFDLYVIQEGQRTTGAATTIVDEQGQRHTHFDVSAWPFLPNYAYSLIRPILISKNEKGIPVIFHSSEHDARKLRRRKTAKYRYPIVHTQTRRGLGLLYADHSSTRRSVPKVILNFNRNLYPYNDFRGEYGLSQLSFGLPIHSEREGDDVMRALESPAFQEIVRATKWSSFQTDYRMFRYFSQNRLLKKYNERV
jgi:hypothetical protein